MPNNQGVILWPSATLTNSNGYDKRFTQIAVGVFTDLHTVTFVYAYLSKHLDAQQLTQNSGHSILDFGFWIEPTDQSGGLYPSLDLVTRSCIFSAAS
jgi:hypothetical protein